MWIPFTSNDIKMMRPSTPFWTSQIFNEIKSLNRNPSKQNEEKKRWHTTPQQQDNKMKVVLQQKFVSSIFYFIQSHNYMINFIRYANYMFTASYHYWPINTDWPVIVWWVTKYHTTLWYLNKVSMKREWNSREV